MPCTEQWLTWIGMAGQKHDSAIVSILYKSCIHMSPVLCAYTDSSEAGAASCAPPREFDVGQLTKKDNAGMSLCRS